MLPKAARTRNGQAVALRWAFVGFVVPCMTALTFIAVSWLGTGAGQLGRLLHKHQQGTGNSQGDPRRQNHQAGKNHAASMLTTVGYGQVYVGIRLVHHIAHAMLFMTSRKGPDPAL